MVTYYNKGDLISFGRFLVGKERKERFAASQEEHGYGRTLDERLSEVHDADFRNWQSERKKERHERERRFEETYSTILDAAQRTVQT